MVQDYYRDLTRKLRDAGYIRVPGGKGTLLDIGTNVPLIANWPGYIKAGSSDDALVDFSDWLPTLAELGVAKIGHKIDGISFAPALFQLPRSSRKSRSFAFSESKGGTAYVRTKQYKLYNDGRYFDIRADAMEKKPLKDVAGRAAKDLELLRAAMQKLNFPKQK